MTQNEKIKQHIETHGSITTLEAFKRYGITRLSARMYDLKREGYQFDTKRETVKNRFGERVGICRYTKL